MIKDKETSPGEDAKNTPSIASVAKPEERDAFLTTKVSDPMLSPGVLVRVIKHFKKDCGSGLELLAKVQDWNNEYLQPPFSESEIKVFLQLFLQGNFQDNQNGKQSANKSKQILDCIKESIDLKLFHDQNRVPYAQVRVGSKLVNMEIMGSDFQNYVRRTFYKKAGDSASEAQINEVAGLLSMEALYDNTQHVLGTRVSAVEDVYYYDLQNNEGEIVKISAEGWEVVPIDSAPLMFKVGTSAIQVKPERGGNFLDFLEFLNFGSEDEKILFLCTLPVRFIRDVEQPIGYIYGPASSGKTTLLKMTKDLIDPSVGGISIPVRKPEDILPLIGKSWLFANDNISKITDEMSDFLCTLATGGESSRRKLYTDGDLHTIGVKNPAFLTGINVEATNSDLLSRSLLFKTEAVIDGKRVSGNELNKKYEALKPKLIGGIFDVLVKAMNIKPTLECKTNFRMQDFALWGAACAEALGIVAMFSEST